MVAASVANSGSAGVAPDAITSSWLRNCASAASRSAGVEFAFVGQVVGTAREAVDGHDGRTQMRRHQAGRDRKILVVTDCHG